MVVTTSVLQDPEIRTRTSWIDADTAKKQVKKVTYKIIQPSTCLNFLNIIFLILFIRNEFSVVHFNNY